MTSLSWLLLLGIATACSIDENANAARDLSQCAKQDQHAGFCLRGGGSKMTDAATPQDAAIDSATGVVDAAAIDANADAGAPMPVDAGEPCDEEGETDYCYTGPKETALQLPCRAGQRTCTDGFWTECDGEVTPQDEVCNGKDDDCNGLTDEKQPAMECSVAGVNGECAHGIAVCQNGSYDKCIQIAFPTSETCDGEKDEDCDGVDDADDNDLLVSCYDEGGGCAGSAGGPYVCTGACHAGALRCVDGTMQTSCGDDQGPGTEVGAANPSDPAIDEDCDGKTDEGVACVNGTMRHCYSGPAGTENVGECKGDDLTCVNMEYGGTCDEVTPVLETCLNPGQDDDCNGTDDDVPGLDTQCMAPGVGECANNGRYECPESAVDAAPVCTPAAPASSEACNTKDDDCDGKTDEGFNLQTDKNNCGACGTKCGAGNAACCAGKCVDLNTNNSHCGSCGNDCDCNCNGAGVCKNRGVLGCLL